MVYIEDIRIDNPVAVWHELKNARAVLGEEGEGWNSSGWYESKHGTMCLANVLRFVGLGESDKPRDYADTLGRGVAEQLVTKLVQKRSGRNTIPSFNDSRTDVSVEDLSPLFFGGDNRHAFAKGFKQIASILDEAAELVKPHAFTHTVTIANEVMTSEEREEVEKALAQDLLDRVTSWWRKRDPRKNKEAREELKERVAELAKESDDPRVLEFREWLDSFEERGWDTFFEELAECDTEDCEQVKMLVGLL